MLQILISGFYRRVIRGSVVRGYIKGVDSRPSSLSNVSGMLQILEVVYMCIFFVSMFCIFALPG